MKLLLSPTEFKDRKREKLLDYKIYKSNFEEVLDTFDVMRATAAILPEIRKNIPANRSMMSSQEFAFEMVDHLATCYSAGHTLAELHSFYPTALETWEQFGRYHKDYHATPEGSVTHVAHLPLLGQGFDQANRLTCFAILLGWGHLLPRLAPLTDYNNPARDAMLELLFAPYVSDRGSPPDECTRHLPYFKTLKIFKAKPEARAELMAEYLDDWYEASRREPYYNSHERHTSFMGYWSWEAAAITHLLDIDDRAYADAMFYPKDLVDWARTHHNLIEEAVQDNALMRCEAGQPCPRPGYWTTPVQANSRRLFKQGVIMPSLAGDYGVTIWQWDPKQV